MEFFFICVCSVLKDIFNNNCGDGYRTKNSQKCINYTNTVHLSMNKRSLTQDIFFCVMIRKNC